MNANSDSGVFTAGSSAASDSPVGTSPQPTPEAHRKDRALIILAAVLGALVVLLGAVLGGTVLFGSDDEPGLGSTDGPVVSEPTEPVEQAPATDLTGLSTFEEEAVLWFEDVFAVDLTAPEEAGLLHDAHICVVQYETGWTFDEIMLDNLSVYQGDTEVSHAVMVVAFDFLAPEHSVEFAQWYFNSA